LSNGGALHETLWLATAGGCLSNGAADGASRVKRALQLLINRYGYIRSAHVHERVSTKSRRFDYRKLEVVLLRRTGHL